MKEVVLPSGRFASLRPITWRDHVATGAISDIGERVITLACRTVTIDGEPLTMEQLLRALCNLQKSTKDPVAFMQQRGFLL